MSRATKGASSTPKTSSLEIRQGHIYYVYLGDKDGSAPAGWHYVVIVQNDGMNRSRLRTTVGCVLTSNLKRGQIRGNTSVSPSESGLPLKSVVNISQVVTLDKRDLMEPQGELDGSKMNEIIRNLHRVLLRGRRD